MWYAKFWPYDSRLSCSSVGLYSEELNNIVCYFTLPSFFLFLLFCLESNSPTATAWHDEKEEKNFFYIDFVSLIDMRRYILMFCNGFKWIEWPIESERKRARKMYEQQKPHERGRKTRSCKLCVTNITHKWNICTFWIRCCCCCIFSHVSFIPLFLFRLHWSMTITSKSVLRRAQWCMCSAYVSASARSRLYYIEIYSIFSCVFSCSWPDCPVLHSIFSEKTNTER